MTKVCEQHTQDSYQMQRGKTMLVRDQLGKTPMTRVCEQL